MANKVSNSIQTRYNNLSESSCCLSCGGAINYSEIKPGEICADLGSGRGYDVIRMAEMTGDSGKIYGIDVSEGMLQKAKKNNIKLGITNVEFIQSELENIILADNSLDVIISNCTINHSLNQGQVWKEIYRLLKPGGRFIVSDIYATETVPDTYRNNPQAIAECWAGSVTREVYEKNLAEAGFSTIEVLEESKPYKKGSINVVSWTIRGKKENI